MRLGRLDDPVLAVTVEQEKQMSDRTLFSLFGLFLSFSALGSEAKPEVGKEGS